MKEEPLMEWFLVDPLHRLYLLQFRSPKINSVVYAPDIFSSPGHERPVIAQRPICQQENQAKRAKVIRKVAVEDKARLLRMALLAPFSSVLPARLT